MNQEENADHIKQIKELEKQLAIADFKLERTEKLKKTLSTLLEETIEELEQKKKAVEDQNHELEIESSLERVRTMAMGINKPDDLLDVCEIMFIELQNMGFNEIRNSMININDDVNKTLLNYDFSTEMGKSINRLYYDIHPVVESQVRMMKSGKDAFSETIFTGKDLESWKEMRRTAGEKDDPRIENIPALYYYFYSIGTGFIGISTFSSISEEKRNVLKRFRNVFDLAYQRYIDVTNAEAQAREAQIELALERIRARTMAMQKSDELSDTAFILFQQFRELGEDPIQITIGIVDEEEGVFEFRVTGADGTGAKIDQAFKADINEPTLLHKIYTAWKSQKKSALIELRGQELLDWVKYRNEKMGSIAGAIYINKYNNDDHRAIHIAFFSKGIISISTIDPIPAESVLLLERFAGVFDLTYTRFLDLQKAEANTREAIKQASIDRVRAQTASMRTTADLDSIIPLIWKELSILGIQFTRCGVFFMDEDHQEIYTYLSTPDGKALAAFHLPYNTPGTTANMLSHWRSKEMYSEHWDEATFIAWTKDLAEKGIMDSSEKYLTENRPENLYLHFFPFLQGMLYVGCNSSLKEQELTVIQTLADAFSSAYARYEDFNKLESAKLQIENTLTDLRQAQAQLIQSEKMASLGELTAGIAHEIQNPLNFINNFSEVNTELIDELGKEIDEGNFNEAKTLAKDIKDNEEKIVHHGKRADTIVKGMLQHSRSSSGVKEPTDINALADEYLRLAYHGLRAKDKTFNAVMKTDFDDSIGNIDIVPQDIGRVILNLITNAFYAVAEKKKNSGEEYKPTVSVSTKKINNQVEVKVEDNGHGIPEKVLDKIFQPFFTTKPTGQGTGLGLSLSYDIIKAHGGELNVETKEGEGTSFIIYLPD